MLFPELTSRSLWDSASNMKLLQDRLNRLIFDFPEARQAEFPPINVWASEEKAVVVAKVPGIDPDSIDLQIVNNTLTLKIKHESEHSDDGQTWHRQERGYGRFARSLELPYAIDSEKVQALCEHGVLTIECWRASADIPKKICIHTS